MLKLCTIVELEMDWLGVGMIIRDASGCPLLLGPLYNMLLIGIS